MIDERKLIEDIKNNIHIVSTRSNGKTIFADFLKKFIENIIKIIEEQPKVDRWIPCDKELPNVHSYGDEGDMVSDIVNVTLINGMVTDDWLLNGTWFNWGRKVIAWQPLPQKYEG